jgi:hypothetical protein
MLLSIKTVLELSSLKHLQSYLLWGLEAWPGLNGYSASLASLKLLSSNLSTGETTNKQATHYE